MISWEWLAGFFEGEGHIYWQDGRRGTKQATSGRLIIGQKDKRPLDAIRDFLVSEGFAEPQFYLRPAGKDPTRSTPCWMLQVNHRRDVIRMLDEMLPWLFQKVDRAVWVRDRLRDMIGQRDRALRLASALRAEGKTWREVKALTGVGPVALSNYARSKQGQVRHIMRKV